MARRFSACIFDLDGTLADTLYSIAGFMNDTLAAFGLPPLPPEDYRWLVGNGADALVRRALARAGADFSEEEIRRFRAEYDRRYESEPLRDAAPYPGIPALLGALSAAGLKLGVLSNKPDNVTRAIVQGLFPGLLDRVHGQREGIPRKPDPTAALALAAELGAAPGEILYAGDSGVDMDTARAAGMISCGVLWGFRPREELEEHGAARLAADAEALRAMILES